MLYDLINQVFWAIVIGDENAEWDFYTTGNVSTCATLDFARNAALSLLNQGQNVRLYRITTNRFGYSSTREEI